MKTPSPEQLYGHTETRIVPLATANAMRKVARKYNKLTIVSIAPPGGKFYQEQIDSYPLDLTFTHLVPKGKEAISIQWRSQTTHPICGVPRKFYEDVHAFLLRTFRIES